VSHFACCYAATYGADIRLPPRQPIALEKTELRKLLRAACGHVRDYAMLELLAGTGLRVGEL
jgi:integrase